MQTDHPGAVASDVQIGLLDNGHTFPLRLGTVADWPPSPGDYKPPRTNVTDLVRVPLEPSGGGYVDSCEKPKTARYPHSSCASDEEEYLSEKRVLGADWKTTIDYLHRRSKAFRQSVGGFACRMYNERREPVSCGQLLRWSPGCVSKATPGMMV